MVHSLLSATGYHLWPTAETALQEFTKPRFRILNCPSVSIYSLKEFIFHRLAIGGNVAWIGNKVVHPPALPFI